MAPSGAKWVGVFLLVALTSCAGLTTAETHTNAGVALHEDRQYERAIAEYDEAIRLDPAIALAYYNRGVAYASLQEFERAVADYDASIRVDPQREEAFNGRAVAYDALGEQALSAEDYQEAARLSRLPRIADDESGLADEVLRTAVDFLSSYGPRVLAAVGEADPGKGGETLGGAIGAFDSRGNEEWK